MGGNLPLGAEYDTRAPWIFDERKKELEEDIEDSIKNTDSDFLDFVADQFFDSFSYDGYNEINREIYLTELTDEERSDIEAEYRTFAKQNYGKDY